MVAVNETPTDTQPRDRFWSDAGCEQVGLSKSRVSKDINICLGQLPLRDPWVKSDKSLIYCVPTTVYAQKASRTVVLVALGDARGRPGTLESRLIYWSGSRPSIRPRGVMAAQPWSDGAPALCQGAFRLHASPMQKDVRRRGQLGAEENAQPGLGCYLP